MSGKLVYWLYWLRMKLWPWGLYWTAEDIKRAREEADGELAVIFHIEDKP